MTEIKCTNHHWISGRKDEDGIPIEKICEYCGARENIYEEMKKLNAKLARFGKHLYYVQKRG
jgi:hypothetical protein